MKCIKGRDENVVSPSENSTPYAGSVSTYLETSPYAIWVSLANYVNGTGVHSSDPLGYGMVDHCKHVYFAAPPQCVTVMAGKT